jgi:hypothetical protein
LLYLLNSAAHLKEEEAEQKSIDYREKQISRYILGGRRGNRNVSPPFALDARRPCRSQSNQG